MIALLACVLTYGTASASLACPFCPPTQPTFSEQLAESDVACLVKWVSVTQSKSLDEVGSATTTFEIVQLLRGRETDFPVKSKITVDFLRMGKPGNLFLVFGKRDEKQIAWSAPVEVTEISYEYIRQAPPLETAAKVRLQYFLKFLEFGDPTIANDAFAEFSRARYADVAELAESLPRKKLRRWLESAETSKVRLGFYGLMLGLCGNDDDAKFLEDRIFAPVAPDDIRLGIDGMIGGYLLLRGEDGLERIVDGKLRSKDTADADLFAVLNALRFAWEYNRDRLPAAKLQAALRLYLDRENFAELVLPDLARWKDWSVLDRLLAQYGKAPFDQDGGKLKIILFAQACVKDRPVEGEPPDRLKTARQFLDRIAAESPELLRQTRRGNPLK